MTARRPSRISGGVPVSGPRDEEQFRRLLHTFNEDLAEHEPAEQLQLQEAVNAHLLQFAREDPDKTDAVAVHPALTDYGPVSAATFFRQARADHRPTLPTPPASLRTGLRPRSGKGSGRQFKQLSDEPVPAHSLITAVREHRDYLEPPCVENQRSSEIPPACQDIGSPWSRTSQNLLGGDENQLPSRRQGPKRPRRTSNRQQSDRDHESWQIASRSYGAALLRDMRLRRAARREREGSSCHDLTSLMNHNTQEPTRESRSNLLTSTNNSMVSTNTRESSVRDKFQATSGSSQPGDDDHDDRANLTDSSFATLDAGVLPVPDQRRPAEGCRAHCRINSLGNRRSTLSTPPRNTQARRQFLRDSVFRALLEDPEQDREASDGGSASSQDALVPNTHLADANANMLQKVTRDLRGRLEDDDSEDMVTPSSQYLTAPVPSIEQQKILSKPSASTLPRADLSPTCPKSFKYERRASVSLLGDRHRKVGTALCQPSSRSKSGDEETAKVEEALSVHMLPVHPYSKNELQQPQSSPPNPPLGQSSSSSFGWPNVPTEIYFEIARYLSREDALHLRLVCRDFSIAMMGPVFGSVVVPFGKNMYDISPSTYAGNPASASMFEKYGLAIRKFGISFETDADMLVKARTKTISNEQSSWWGKYKWPTPVYPRFSHLHSLENLADNVLLLKSAMANLGKTHELGLSVDSGHGWLNGPDISDMALFSHRCGKRAKVFGRNLAAEDQQKQEIRAYLFECAQAKTLQECIEILQTYNKVFPTKDIAFLRSLTIRDLESFRRIERQPDFDAAAHVGGAIPTSNNAANIAQQPLGGQHHIGGGLNQPANVGLNPGVHHPGAVSHFQPVAIGQNYNHPHQSHQYIAAAHPANFHNITYPAPPSHPNAAATYLPPQDHNVHRQNIRERGRNQVGAVEASRRPQTTQPQFPLIFNGYNLSAEVGGWCHLIQRKVAAPHSFPLQPGTLTEAQAQWLMETVWAQRAFLSAYTTSILANKTCFSQVHSLHIAKISSGLLSALEQRELWAGLPSLSTLTMLVSPDWRVEHVTGDQGFNSNMLVSPANASLQLTQFLKVYITPLEKLSNLTIGFVDGGEHAVGIMARNQHLLPAPISSGPRTWLSNHTTEPDPRTIITFNHIKHLTVQNAWFSPLMLEGFMVKSRDTSLRTLTLDSISLTATHSQRLVAPLTTAIESLDPIHPPSMWLHESLPTTHGWPATIDRITPGRTFLDRKYDAGMIPDPYTNPRPAPSFRGFVSRLVFKSCGYVRVSGLSNQEYNQNDLVCPNSDPMDAGLKSRAAALAEKGVMLSDKNPSTGAEWPLLGRLTQCIHPVEKRVLEQAWDMEFGWHDDLERWAATEDGCFEGGTGRFSGVIVGEGGKGIGGKEA